MFLFVLVLIVEKKCVVSGLLKLNVCMCVLLLDRMLVMMKLVVLLNMCVLVFGCVGVVVLVVVVGVVVGRLMILCVMLLFVSVWYVLVSDSSVMLVLLSVRLKL